ncbi:hypothetical protein PX52LOC_05340 [Limnoglobus roseus]|uniref:Uncharacterized protein n=2 Tax=Limnoglobus roseus TaxID=2598579 RepID=A0A5C1AFV7_9BACT|nr:hypothetical protein PX52LOC_05340 [Limnoglobus roseus]
MLLRPEWDRTCADCQRFQFDDEEESPRRGRVELTRDGDPLPRATDPPCRRCPKVPASVLDVRQRTGGRVTPADAVEPDDRHRRAVEHYLACAAVNQFPDDDWVRDHARLIRPLARQADDRPLLHLTAAVRSLAGRVARD